MPIINLTMALLAAFTAFAPLAMVVLVLSRPVAARAPRRTR